MDRINRNYGMTQKWGSKVILGGETVPSIDQ